jgi:hypothetical protein
LRLELDNLNRKLQNPQAEWDLLCPLLRAGFDDDPKQWIKGQMEEKEQIQSLMYLLEQKKTVRKEMELALQLGLQEEKTVRKEMELAVQEEKTAREKMELALQLALQEEKTAREKTELALQLALQEEKTAREKMKLALQEEKTAREKMKLAVQEERLRVMAGPLAEVTCSSSYPNLPSPKLDAFWRYLSTAKETEGFLPLTVRFGILPQRMVSLYIRESYCELYKRMISYFDEGWNGFALTGTPGIGKSVFLFYLLWRLARREKPPEAILIHRAQDMGFIYLITSNGCFATRDPVSVAHFLVKKTTWYLTDTLDPEPTLPFATTILVASPNRKHYKEFLKVHDAVPLHYLEPWSLEELLIAAPKYDIPCDVVRERYGLSHRLFKTTCLLRVPKFRL